MFMFITCSVDLPQHWADMNGERCRRIDLQPLDQEYQDVAANFSKSGLKVKKVNPIINTLLYKQERWLGQRKAPPPIICDIQIKVVISCRQIYAYNKDLLPLKI